MRSNSFVTFLLIILLSQLCHCEFGIDVASAVSISDFTCMKQKLGAKFIIVRAYRSFGGIDPNAPQTLKNAQSIGLQTDIYMFPCRGKSPQTQAQEMLEKTPSNLYGKVWIDVQTNPSPGCSWSGHDSKSNCDFLVSIAKYIKSKGKSVGVYSSAVMWQNILGAKMNCPELAGQAPDIWYPHYDKSPSFSDFSGFGGWTKPKIKQYDGDVTLCNIDSDKNFR